MAQPANASERRSSDRHPTNSLRNRVSTGRKGAPDRIQILVAEFCGVEQVFCALATAQTDALTYTPMGYKLMSERARGDQA